MPAFDLSRRAAAAIVSAVTDEGRTLDVALSSIRSFKALEGRDRAFARAIASATLRRLGGLDAAIAPFLERPLGPGGEAPRAILRTGAAQLLVLNTPAHAVVSQAVALAAGHRKASKFKGLINAVLRRLDQEGRPAFAAQATGVDLPDWIFARWRAVYGDEKAAAIAAALRDEPPLDLTAKDDAEGWATRLGGVSGPFGSIRLSAPGDITALEGYADGAWWVQDAAASLPARLLGPVAGKTVFDLCAAPGGKTMQLAASGARVTAVDVDAQRLERVKENLARTGLSAEIVAADIETWAPPTLADAILLDAPCTATGTMRRHPDVAWLRRPHDIGAASLTQARLLASAAAMLKPGGVLVYAVCSLEPEEGPDIAGRAAAAGLSPAPVSAAEVGGDESLLTPAGAVRCTPAHAADQGGMDGFFIARFTKAP